ncbi:hypothetical protein GPJ56_008426 [Histomonas meleagridis]|uniref:uncharacterized protein n=1 Tax=Histomonas meleagridis TaxID=135588 RepID=UPI00355973E8|nr:hypothetical protein GPJ56_008426 [Histomonas meleagridis]KAH0806482.1 hypothetical protein GO595_000644 [Histomonas meleagridis]
MSDDLFPKTVFVKELPDEYKMSELAELLEQFGNIIEIAKMEDGHICVQFQTGAESKAAVTQASGRKGKTLEFKGKLLHIIPKRNRKKGKPQNK